MIYMNYITDLVETQEIIYKSLGSSVELVCPIVNTYRIITWLGPPNLSVYAVGTDVLTELSSQVDISESDIDKKSILLIKHFTKDKSGKFRCSVFNRNPSNLVIVNATGDKITTVEGRQNNLECRVTSGQPGGNITWSTDGVVVAENGPSLVTYSLTPKKSDNGKLFKCEAFPAEGKSVLESSVLLKVFCKFVCLDNDLHF
ncbi:unnamed protein product [Mytilus edulis]|uniref:Ig-like domain-containing protein n=1 Tax=Mytilus edulis TaxID=6550 RepID=A0A8S3QT32_MYTED|nr:unnamed protein product [Mytilus edulis]